MKDIVETYEGILNSLFSIRPQDKFLYIRMGDLKVAVPRSTEYWKIKKRKVINKKEIEFPPLSKGQIFNFFSIEDSDGNILISGYLNHIFKAKKEEIVIFSPGTLKIKMNVIKW